MRDYILNWKRKNITSKRNTVNETYDHRLAKASQEKYLSNVRTQAIKVHVVEIWVRKEWHKSKQEKHYLIY